MKRKYFRLLIVILAPGFFSGLILTGCKKQESEPIATAETGAEAPAEKPLETGPKAQSDFPELTSVQAAQLAYPEARKWNSDAVLWYLTSPAKYLDYRWGENDQAWQWVVIFVNPRNEKRYNIQIRGDRIVSQEEEKFVKRESRVDPSFPKDRPGVSMKDAAQKAFEAGAPGWEKPMFYYIIDNNNPAYKGKPVWDFVFGSQMVAYTIDGISGRLLETRFLDLAGSKPITAEEIKSLPPGKDENQIQDEDFIYGFYDLVNQKKLDEAIAMMTGELAGNDQARQMWENVFANLEKVKVIDLAAEDQGSGENSPRVYRVLIYARLKNPGQSRNWSEGENTRWITVSAWGEARKISQIAAGR